MSFSHFKIGKYGNINIVLCDVLMPGDESEPDSEFINLENIDGSNSVFSYIYSDEKGEYIRLSQEDVQEIGFDCTTIPASCKEVINDDVTGISSVILRYSDRFIEPNSEIVPAEDKQLEIIDSAETIHIRITENFFKVEKTLYEICIDLKTIRDNKYYKQLGFDTFESYCSTCFNITRRQGHRYLSIAENLNSDFVTSMSHFGSTKLYILSRLSDSERSEMLETTDIEHTSVKQLEEKSKKIRQNRGVTEGETSPAPSVSTSLESRFIQVYGKQNNALVLLFVKKLRETANLLSYKNILEYNCNKIDTDYLLEVCNAITIFLRGINDLHHCGTGMTIHKLAKNVSDILLKGGEDNE